MNDFSMLTGEVGDVIHYKGALCIVLESENNSVKKLQPLTQYIADTTIVRYRDIALPISEVIKVESDRYLRNHAEKQINKEHTKK